MTRSKSAVAAVAVACLALPISLFATPAFAAPSAVKQKLPSAVVFAERDDEDHEDEDGAGHHEGHHQIPPVIIRPHEDNEHEDDEDSWNESEDGDSEDEDSDDDHGGFVVPGPGLPPGPNPAPGTDPTAMPFVPNDATGASVTSTGYSVSPVTGLGADSVGLNQQPGAEARNLNPEAAPPAQIQQVRGPQRTPADVFIESATVGLLAVGSGALALGGVAGVRAIKLRRNPKGDYFYDNN